MAKSIAELRSLLELTINAADIGTFDLDLTTGELAMNTRLLDLSDIPVEGFNGSAEQVYANMHADDVEGVVAKVNRAVDEGIGYDAEYRVVCRDQSTRWVAARGQCQLDDNGRPSHLLGAAWDITETREARARLEDALESLTIGFLAMDRDWTITYVNGEAERIASAKRPELVGRVFWDAFPAALNSPFETAYRAVKETGEPARFDAFYPEPVNAWVDVRAVRDRDGIALYFYDITERRQAQLEIERVARRAHFVADVSAELTRSLEAETAVGRLAQVLVPELADWCVITLVDDTELDHPNGLHHVASWHVEETLRDVTTAYGSASLSSATPTMPLMQAIATGAPVHVAYHATAVLQSHLLAGEAVTLLGELCPASVLTIPLIGRGRTVGVLTLARGVDRAPMDDEELTVAKDVAARTGLALDSSRLYRQQRALATSLQLSLLTEPPQPDRAEIVARYVPAGGESQVGGDWYDAFLQKDGSTTLVIGDVIGHDAAAAASMSQVRTLLRGTAALTGASPAAALAQTEEVMELLLVETTATAAVVRLEQTREQHAQGRTSVRWSSAGHPPPMILHASGEVEALRTEAVDIPLGIFPGHPRHEHLYEVDRGSTVLLFTDGLIERRGQDLDAGLELLGSLLAAYAEMPLEELCDRLLLELVPADVEDDVALIAVRLHRQDQPRE